MFQPASEATEYLPLLNTCTTGKDELPVKTIGVKLLSLLLVLCLLLPVLSFAEEEGELSLEEVFEDVMLDDDGNEYPTDLDETELAAADEAADEPEEDDESAYYITEAVPDSLADLDVEPDTGVDPSDLELNTLLPEDIINILLIGVDTRDTSLDKGYQHGDVQIVLSLNLKEGTVKLTSLLHDLYVPIPGYKNWNRINLSYQRGGGQLAMRTINHSFDLNIQNYVTINFFGLASIIDALGGIDIDMSKTEAAAVNAYLRQHPPAYDNKAKGERVALEKKTGVQHCDGVQAVMYARLRKIDSDFERTGRQRHLLDLLLKEVMKQVSEDPLNTALNLFEIVMGGNGGQPYVSTNMNMETMWNIAMGVLGSPLVERAMTVGADSLIEEQRVPCDYKDAKGKAKRTYAYTMVNGDSMVSLGKKLTSGNESKPNNFDINRQQLHLFIYGTTDYIVTK